MAKNSLVPTVKLNDGSEIPSIAFGTGSKLKFTDVTQYVQNALEAGFSHIDTAAFYDTEQYVATALRESGLAREDVYITTKFDGGDISTEARKSIDKLGVKYVDLYLIHGPTFAPDVAKAWREFESIHKDGIVKSIGVSNFRLEHLQQAVDVATVLPVVNQINFSPYNYASWKGVLELAAKHNIVIEAYSSLSPITAFPGGPLDPVLDRIAARIGGTPAQVIFKWVLAKGAVVVTTSTKRERLDEYLATPSLPDLTAEEIADIEAAGAKGPPSRFNPLVQVRRAMRGGVQALTATAIVFLNICMAYMLFHWLRLVFRL
ncbi:Aldo/keto reductase [Peniophora sp. CONT]|nr:Aldo/keto reductase [Peniophora sp. CONT]